MSKFYIADDPALQAEISGIFGRDRFGTYLADSGGDVRRALQLYVWNAALGGAFLPSIGAVEVALRNALSDRLTIGFQPHWYDDPSFLAVDPQAFTGSIARAKTQIKSGGKAITYPRMVAQFTIGFWVMLLRPAYGRSLWPLFRPAFAPYTRRRKVTDALDPLAAFRNRVAHHEAIYNRDPRNMYERLIRGARLLSPSLGGWIEHHSRVPQLLASGPSRVADPF